MNNENPSSVAPQSLPSAEVGTMLAFFTAGHFQQAGETACALIASDPEHGFGWKVLGVVRHRELRIDEALAAMQQAVRYLPNDTEARFNLGCLLQQIGRLPAAQEQCHAVLALDPLHASTHSILVRIYRALHELVAAARSFRQALTLDASELSAHVGLAHVLMFQDALPDAITHFRQALPPQTPSAQAQ
jgi:protein O-GlcNAc transferase